MAEIVFSTQRRNFERGRHYQNPKFFDGRFPKGTTHVYVLGDWPKVIEAAEEQEIAHTQLAPGAPISWRDGIAPVDPNEELVEIPKTWAQFGAPRMIAIAAAIARRDVANRKQAVRIIEDELERRVALDEHRTPDVVEDEDEPEDNGENGGDFTDASQIEPEEGGDEEGDEEESPPEQPKSTNKKSSRRNRRK